MWLVMDLEKLTTKKKIVDQVRKLPLIQLGIVIYRHYLDLKTWDAKMLSAEL